MEQTNSRLYRLKMKRTESNLTQKEVADELNVSEAYYSMIESGKRRPSYSVMLMLSKIFKVKPDYFFYPDN